MYVPLSPTDVAQNGTQMALIHQLQNDVRPSFLIQFKITINEMGIVVFIIVRICIASGHRKFSFHEHFGVLKSHRFVVPDVYR